MPNKRLIMTIDTEPDCDTHWRRSNPLTFNSVTRGIPQFFRPLWDKYGVNPIYFVSPEVLEDDKSCGVLKDEIRRGAIVGAHLHSEYIEPDKRDVPGKPSEEFPCFAHSTEIEFQKIKNLTSLIQEKLGVKPEWYRAARFGADLDTIKSLKQLGYKYDSSVTPHINWSKIGGPDHSNAPEEPYWISPDNYYKESPENESIGIKEFPVTISGKRFGFFGKFFPDHWLFYKWLGPAGMSAWELRRLIDEFCDKYDDCVLISMFHSMEVIINATPYVRNRLMQKLFLKRLEEILKYYKIRI